MGLSFCKFEGKEALDLLGCYLPQWIEVPVWFRQDPGETKALSQGILHG